MNAARLWLVVSLVSLASAAPALRGRAERLQPAPPGVAERKPSWDIAAPYGPTRTLEFETSEGTWMNVDVSPDGRTIVFDLMGDIYTMPIEGSGASPARRLTSGPAFDMQPRFSPDGRRIAFSSDRDGLWNIWVMDTDGSNARQVSSERRWFVNSPTWSPDGAYIYARRHFVRERSLGAGEIWMYHAGTTSEGLQVTEKTSWQKDAGEPAVSPDGRYLYYSKDVTPGQTFEYNKDPHGVIYAIVRRDLTTGRERTLVQRPGGSVAPRPSPDGRRLAFVRRVGTGSVLFLRDLRTGEEQPIFDRLDKDLQEAWAIHGVYAQYGWTPDSRHIVIWGEGKIWKVDVEARKGEIVPFTARVETRIHEPLRFPQEVHPDEFPVRMLRDVTTSPDGRLVAYGALGRIYVKRLPDGPPQRLTAPASTTDDGARAFGAPVPPAEGTGRDGSGPAGAAMAPVAGGAGTARGTDAARGATRLQEEGEDWLEFDPAFSPDGRWIAFVAWNDRRFGRVRVAPAAGGPARDVVSEPGHYVEPAFSPDGRRLVYRKTRGDQVRGPTHGEEPGIYVVQIDPPGEPRLVRETGTDPQFDHTGERIYFRDRRDDRFVLASVDLDGSDEVVHFRSENATEIVPSPDGRWV
ncbi:MAG TPA: hypothetical protein VNK92_01020, partial [Vicinamibacterales bacterium]|nr:hypothetical protein [Vicinamibacterales bacterium]